MELYKDELVLLRYLHEYCPTPDNAGALAVGIEWKKPAGSNESHTTALSELFGTKWTEFAEVADKLCKKGIIGLDRRTSILRCWVTQAGREVVVSSNPMQEGGMAAARSSLWERIVSVVVGSIGIALNRIRDHSQ